MSETNALELMGFTQEDAEKWVLDLKEITLKSRYLHDVMEGVMHKYKDNPREMAMVMYTFGCINGTGIELAKHDKSFASMCNRYEDAQGRHTKGT